MMWGCPGTHLAHRLGQVPGGRQETLWPLSQPSDKAGKPPQTHVAGRRPARCDSCVSALTGGGTLKPAPQTASWCAPVALDGLPLEAHVSGSPSLLREGKSQRLLQEELRWSPVMARQAAGTAPYLLGPGAVPKLGLSGDLMPIPRGKGRRGCGGGWGPFSSDSPACIS